MLNKRSRIVYSKVVSQNGVEALRNPAPLERYATKQNAFSVYRRCTTSGRSQNMVDDQGDPVLQALLKNRMDPIIYETYAVDIRRSVAHKLGQPIEHPDSDDCVQETFKNAYRNLPSK